MIDPHHPLYGNSFPVSDRVSGRGRRLVVVQLPDGRERSIPRSARDLVCRSDDGAAEASHRAHISVRTLLPLANHVRAVLASRNAGRKRDGGQPEQTPTGPEQDGCSRGDGGAATVVVTASDRDPASVGAACGVAAATSVAAVD